MVDDRKVENPAIDRGVNSQFILYEASGSGKNNFPNLFSDELSTELSSFS